MNQSEITIYHIYGRTSYEEPLAFVESVSVAQGNRPGLPAGSDWVEVIAFPEAAIIQVIPDPREKES